MLRMRGNPLYLRCILYMLYIYIILLYQPKGADLYKNLHIEWIRGRVPVLLIMDDSGDLLEEVNLSKV